MVMHGGFVCPTVSMVTTSHATGLEKTISLSVASRQHIIIHLQGLR